VDGRSLESLHGERPIAAYRNSPVVKFECPDPASRGLTLRLGGGLPLADVWFPVGLHEADLGLARSTNRRLVLALPRTYAAGQKQAVNFGVQPPPLEVGRTEELGEWLIGLTPDN
jgi:hypothetical protein